MDEHAWYLDSTCRSCNRKTVFLNRAETVKNGVVKPIYSKLCRFCQTSESVTQKTFFMLMDYGVRRVKVTDVVK